MVVYALHSKVFKILVVDRAYSVPSVGLKFELLWKWEDLMELLEERLSVAALIQVPSFVGKERQRLQMDSIYGLFHVNNAHHHLTERDMVAVVHHLSR